MRRCMRSGPAQGRGPTRDVCPSGSRRDSWVCPAGQPNRGSIAPGSVRYDSVHHEGAGGTNGGIGLFSPARRW